MNQLKAESQKRVEVSLCFVCDHLGSAERDVEVVLCLSSGGFLERLSRKSVSVTVLAHRSQQGFNNLMNLLPTEERGAHKVGKLKQNMKSEFCKSVLFLNIVRYIFGRF